MNIGKVKQATLLVASKSMFDQVKGASVGH